MNQATRYTKKELAYLSFWEGKGYTFKPGQKPPMNTWTPPSFAQRHPIRDAALALTIILSAAGLLCYWLGTAAGII